MNMSHTSYTAYDSAVVFNSRHDLFLNEQQQQQHLPQSATDNNEFKKLQQLKIK